MPDPHRPSPIRIGYVLKQYPRLSETFILNEILGLERRGLDTSIYSLRPPTEGRFHPSIADVKGAVRYLGRPDKEGFLGAMRAIARLDAGALPAVVDFVDRLPESARAGVLVQAVELAAAVREDGIDHLHAHFLTVAAHTAHVAHLLTGVDYSVTAHAKDIYRHAVDWGLAARVAGSAAAVVTVCDANLDFLNRRLATTPARVVRIYNGLGPQLPPGPPTERTPGLVLGVGRLVEKKGFDVLLDAVAALARRRSEVHCVIVGDGEERGSLEARVDRLGLRSRVVFAGALGQHEVAAWMRRAQVLGLPCRVGVDGNQDALPTVLLEALGAGLPVVSTPVAGIPEIVTDGVEGRLVPADDAGAFAAAIDAILADPVTWDEMSTAGPRKLAARFDRDRTIEELVATFRTPAGVA